MRKEQIILEYLEIKYGNCQVYEDKKTIGISGVCIFFKKTKQVAFVGMSHRDLCDWFGDGKYHPVLEKWFTEKLNLVL
jgi:hypothetical protein